MEKKIDFYIDAPSYTNSEDWRIRCEARYYLSHYQDHEIKDLIRNISEKRSKDSVKRLKEMLNQEWSFVARTSKLR